MSLSIDEFRLIKKFMAMTTSESDAEALAALRRANAILARHGLTWDMVLTKVVTVGIEVEAAPYDDPEPYDDPARGARASYRAEKAKHR